MTMLRRTKHSIAGCTAVIAVIFALQVGGAQAEDAPPVNRTQVVLLGTGTPRPLPARSGPSTAVVVDDIAYLVDISEEQKWPLVVHAHEIEPGVVYQDDRITVTAFRVRHGQWQHAYGYAFKTPDRTIVISGDASPSPALIEACRKCDVLIHEVYSPSGVAPMPNWAEYRKHYHTSTPELGEIARTTQPGLLIVHHTSGRGPNGGTISDEQYLGEIQEIYKGKVVMGHDLDIY